MDNLELNLLKQEIEEIGNRIDAYEYGGDLDAMFGDIDLYQEKWDEYNELYKNKSNEKYL